MAFEVRGASRRHWARLPAAVLLSTVLGMGAAACGSGGAAGSGAGPGASSGAATDPLATLSAGQVVNRAVHDLRTANAVHVSGNVVDSGQSIGLDLTLLGRTGCTGTMTMHGKGSFRLIMIRKRVWIKPDRKFWRTFGGNNSAALQLLQGKYLKMSATGSGLGSLSDLCKPSKLAAGFGGISSGVTGKPQHLTVAGQPALRFSGKDGKGSGTVDVSDSATPEILRITSTGSAVGHIEFTGYGQTVALTAPPASQTLSGKQFGL